MRGLRFGVDLPDGVQAKEAILPAIQDHGDGVPFSELCGRCLRHMGFLDFLQKFLLEGFPVLRIVAQDAPVYSVIALSRQTFCSYTFAAPWTGVVSKCLTRNLASITRPFTRTAVVRRLNMTQKKPWTG